MLRRPLDDLQQIKTHHHTTVNDVLLATVAGGLRRFIADRGEEPVNLKTMVPVSVRGDAGDGELGNRISILFTELPCGETEPLVRLMTINKATSQRKPADEPAGSDAALRALGHAPRMLQHAASRIVASPRTFNLVVSNIPGPRLPLYMLGCELKEVYPVVPLAAGHALSIGITTVQRTACFGLCGRGATASRRPRRPPPLRAVLDRPGTSPSTRSRAPETAHPSTLAASSQAPETATTLPRRRRRRRRRRRGRPPRPGMWGCSN